MKRFLPCLLCLLLSPALWASHLKGAYITYQFMSTRTYSISLTVVSDPTSASDNNTATAMIYFGDGASEQVNRTSMVTVNSTTKLNVYTIVHTYAADGAYLVSYSDPNMVDNIININGGDSRAVTMLAESMIRVGPSMTASSHVPQGFIAEPVTTNGQDFYYRPTCYASNNDSISYELIKLPGVTHTYPPGLSIDPLSGMITWNPVDDIPGTQRYFILYKVHGFRNGAETGYITIGQTIRAEHYPLLFPATVSFPSCDLTNRKWYKKMISNTDPIDQQFSFPDANNAFQTNVIGETPVTFTDQSTPGTDQTAIHIAGGSDLVPRSWPYFYTVRTAVNTPYYISRDHILAVYYGASLTLSISELEKNAQHTHVYPNPFKNVCEFTLDESSQYEVTLIDVAGKAVLSSKGTGASFSLNATGLRAGNYTYLIRTQDGKMVTGKLLLEE